MAGPAGAVVVHGALFSISPRDVEAREAVPAGRDDSGNWTPAREARPAYRVYDCLVDTTALGGGFLELLVRDPAPAGFVKGAVIEVIGHPYVHVSRGRNGWFRSVRIAADHVTVKSAPADAGKAAG